MAGFIPGPPCVPEPLKEVHFYCKLRLILGMRPLQPQPVSHGDRCSGDKLKAQSQAPRLTHWGLQAALGAETPPKGRQGLYSLGWQTSAMHVKRRTITEVQGSTQFPLQASRAERCWHVPGQLGGSFSWAQLFFSTPAQTVHW